MSLALAAEHHPGEETAAPATRPSVFTPYLYGEDYPADAHICGELTVLADRVFVCVDDPEHVERDHRRYRPEAHGFVRMHRNPDTKFSTTARAPDSLP